MIRTIFRALSDFAAGFIAALVHYQIRSWVSGKPLVWHEEWRGLLAAGVINGLFFVVLFLVGRRGSARKTRSAGMIDRLGR